MTVGTPHTSLGLKEIAIVIYINECKVEVEESVQICIALKKISDS